MKEQGDLERKGRVVDHTSRDARVAIASVVNRLEPHRSRVAVIYAKTQRPVSDAERATLREECKAISDAIQRARVELIEELIDAPRKVLAHSRVADAERALDNLEAAVARCQKLLEV
jgi:hypothetical protein